MATKKTAFFLTGCFYYCRLNLMANNFYFKVLKQNWEIVVTLILVAAVLSLIISALGQAEYEAKLKVLVIQKQRGQMDPYRAAQSAEFLANLLSKVIYSSSFRAHIQESTFNLPKDIFSGEPRQIIKKWKRAIGANVLGDTGILEIAAYAPKKEEAAEAARAVAYVFINFGQEYYGQDSEVEVRTIDDALVSEKPARPKIWRNVFLGGFFGLVAGYLISWLKGSRQSAVG